jgi:hypothetical protein
MQRLSCCLSSAALVLWAGLSEAAFVHVATSGNNKTADGTQEKPFASIQRAMEAASAGDTVLVAAGTYKERLEVEKSGTAAQGYLTIMGEDGAVLSGAGLPGEATCSIENQSYVRLVNLHFTENKSPTESYAVLIQGSGTNLEVVNCHFSKLTGKNAVAVAVHGSSPEKALEKVKVEGCVIQDCQPAPSEAIVMNGNVDGFEVIGNRITNINNIAIDFIGGEATTLKDKSKVARNGVCRGNFVQKARSNYEGGYAAGIYVDGGKDILIEYNTVTECDLGIELGAENRGLLTSGVTVRKNHIFLNDKAGIALGGYEAKVGRVKNCKVEGNAFYKNTMAKDSQGELWLQQCSDNTVTGNTFWVKDGGMMVAADFGGLKNTVNDNQWWCDAGPVAVRWQWGGDPSAGYQAYLKTSKQDAGSTFSKPDFPNPEKGEFHQARVN